MFKNKKQEKEEKEEVKNWLKHEAQFCNTEETTDYLKDYTFKFIDECISALEKEGYSICLVENKEGLQPLFT